MAPGSRGFLLKRHAESDWRTENFSPGDGGGRRNKAISWAKSAELAGSPDPNVQRSSDYTNIALTAHRSRNR
jgi:hypothetical protein